MVPNYAVFIGRFQPFHNAHYEIIKHALGKYDRLIIGVGSARQARSPKNPFTAEERVALIRSVLTVEEQSRVEFLQLRDYLYNDNQWITDVQHKVQSLTEHDPGQINIIGRLKDRSSVYLRMFPQWKCDEYHIQHPLDATMVRRALFDGTEYAHLVPPQVSSWLDEWKKGQDFAWLLDEHRFIDEYKALWAKTKYPVTFVTTDAVVIQSGHVLMVRRRAAPGKGLLALPGGFVSQDESIEKSMLRELKEETRLQVPSPIIKSSIIDNRVFDHPDRSLRGRIVTHAFCIRLDPRRDDNFDLPEVKGGDDADKAFWMPLVDLYEHENKCFEDHAHIIRFFANKF